MDLDSYFQDLMSIDRSEWNNIPIPLTKAIKTIKKCLTGLNLIVKTNTEEISSLSKKVSMQLETYDSEINSIQKIVAGSEINLKKQVKEITEKLKQTKTVLQTNLSTEVEYMKKTYDGKFMYLDNQIKNNQSSIKSLPKFEDLDKSIKVFVENSNIALSSTLKEEIKNWFIEPEILKINERFQGLDQLHENLLKKIENDLEANQKEKEEIRQDLRTKIEEVNDNCQGIQNKIEKTSSEIENQNIRLTQKINEALKKTQTQVDTCVLTMNNSQDKVMKIIKEIKNEIESQAHEITNIKESYVPPSPSVVFDQFPSPSGTQEKLEIKPKKPKEKPNKNQDFMQGFKDTVTNMQNDFNRLKEELQQSINKNESSSKQTMKTFSEFVEMNVNQMKIEVSDSLLELREKLKWLPINLKDIKGMSANEARIFILEARLRSEENIRSEQITKLIDMFDNFKVDLKSNSDFNNIGSLLPCINSGVGSQTTEFFTRDFYKNPPRSFRNSPTPDKSKFQIPKNLKISMSVDIRKRNKSKVDSY